MANRTLRWGVVGCAGIAKRAVIPGIQNSETGEVAAIASRDAVKARQTADELNIPKSYGSYEELLADDSLDAVYIPLPNHLHREWALKAAAAGKHVLCEKPMALTAAEAQEMVDVCADAGVLLAEAFMYRHHPRYAVIKQLIADGEIGDIRGIHGTFTFNNAKDANNVRYRRAMGGGSLYDVGCYPISAARLILDAEPEAVTAHAFFSPQHDNVDMMVSGLLEFPNHVALTFDCGMWADFRNTLEILGSDGRIEIPNAFIGNSHIFVTAKGQRREETFPEMNQYALQADSFGNSVLHHQPLAFHPQDAVQNMHILDACFAAADQRQRVEIKGGGHAL